MIVEINYVLCDIVVEGFGTGGDLDVSREVEVFHVVRAVALLLDVALTSRPEGLNSIQFSFFHLDIGVGLDARD